VGEQGAGAALAAQPFPPGDGAAEAAELVGTQRVHGRPVGVGISVGGLGFVVVRHAGKVAADGWDAVTT
jgi:hypothetical protein